MHNSYSWQLNDLEMTLHLGACIAQSLHGTETIFIYGNLGTGKTSLCRAIITALGYQGAIKSPTYTIIESYNINKFYINHLDLYRIADAEELYYIGIDEQLANGIALIEWPDKGKGVINQPDLKIYLEYQDNGRSIKLVSSSELGMQLLSSIRRLVKFKD